MAKETFTVEKDIFTVGNHNGDFYGEQVLDEVIANFEKMKDNFKVPLKIDVMKYAPDASKFHGGVPAFGWVTALRKESGRLFAKIENVPKKLKEIIENKGYRQVSIELLTNFKQGTERLGHVLKGIALLGVEHPGCENLTDIWKFYEAEFEGEEVKVFVVEENKKEEHMALTPEQEQELRDKATKAEKDAADAKTFAAKLEQEKKDLQAKIDEDNRKARELADSQRKEGIRLFVEAQVKAGHILPKHTVLVTSVMESLDNSAELKFKAADGKEEVLSPLKAFERLVADMPELVKLGQKTTEGEKAPETKEFEAKPEAEAGTEASQKLDFAAREYMKEHKDVTYRDALVIVSRQGKKEEGK